MPRSIKKKTETPVDTPKPSTGKPARFVELEDEFAGLEPFVSEDEPPKPELNLMQKSKQFRQDCFLEAYVAAQGNITAARKLVKVDHKTVWRWFHEDEEFGKRLNRKMLEWEFMLRQKAFQMAMSGDRVMIIFLLKFVNPFFDDAFRGKILLGEMAQSLYERFPIPQPEFLPPEVPERFRTSTANNGAHEEGSKEIPSSLVHGGGNQ